MKKLNGLETTLERVGRILSRKYNISVRCKGNECKTDGRTIWLPALPDNISESLWTLVRGELDHEAAHILFSDFNGPMKNFKQKWGDFGFDTLNVIEDVRVNYAMQKEYPGSRQNILHSIAEITLTHPINQMPLPVRFLCGLFLAGMDLPYDQYGKDAIELVEQFKNNAERFKSLRNTDEACAMAESILKRLKHQAERESQSSSSQQSKNKQGNQESQSQSSSCKTDKQSPEEDLQSSQIDSSSGEEQSDNLHRDLNDHKDDSGDQKDDSSSKTPFSSNSNKSDKTEDAVQGALEQALAGQYSSTGHPFEIKGTIREQVREEFGDGTNQAYRVYDPSLDKAVVPLSLDNGETYQNLSNVVRPHLGALRQQLIRTLRSRDARFWVSDQEEGQVNSKRLYALLNQGSNKVFRQIQECESDSVAVSLLIDLSGSMNGPRIYLARQVAILFAETLNQLRIPSEVIGFTTEPSKRAFARLTRETGMDLQELSKLYTRFFPCVYSIFKAFEEPFRALKPRIPAMNALEYTPIDDAILFTAKRIIVRKETRKIILVLTDGEPYSGNPAMQLTVIKHLEENLRKCEQAGIECVAVGIKTDYVKNFFKENVVVQNLPELPKVFYAKFSELLRRNRK